MRNVSCPSGVFVMLARPHQLPAFNRGLLLCAAAAMIALLAGVPGSSAASDCSAPPAGSSRGSRLAWAWTRCRRSRSCWPRRRR